MRLAFCCSSLEAGQDGVGDYTRRLASELIRQSYPCVILALNDAHISGPQVESQEMEGVPVPVMRLPHTRDWGSRLAEARNWLNTFNPDWLSFQFVPFGYHRKGLPFGLGKRLAALNGHAAKHIMFHELWVGLDESSRFKHRLWGAMQRIIIMDMVSRLGPRLVHTQTEPYRIVLGQEKIKASILPLFGNILPVNGDGWNGLLEPLVTEAMGKKMDRNKLYLAGIFGAVHPEWNAREAVNVLLPIVRRFQKRLVLVFHGKSNLTQENFSRLKFELLNDADVITTGERTNAEISRILQALDLGLATTPLQIIQKSGTVAAMLEHGLPVLVTRDDWRLRGANFQMGEVSPRLIVSKQLSLLETLPMRNPWYSEGNGARRVAGQMLAGMKAS
jgi:hypothetical protein